MMPYLGLKRGSADTSVVMKAIRKPKFVDNALHLGEYSPQNDLAKKVTVKQRKTANYAIATERAYNITELQDSMILKQPQTHGRNYQGSIVYMGSAVTSDAASNKPVLIYGKEFTDERLRPSSLMNSGTGTTFAVKNMKGKDFKGLGFTQTQGHFAQPIDVGLRTTDLAIRLSRDIADTLTSVNIALPMAANNSEIDRRRHSDSFVGVDFHGITLVDALRFISRHDSRVIHFDRFGNLLYVPFQFEEGSRFVDHMARTGPAQTNTVDYISNRVIVEGVETAVNDSAFAEVNNSEKQSNADIVEEPQVIGDFTVRSNEQAREVARNVLKANSVMLGNLTSAGHPNAWDLRPGMTIEYNGEKKMLIEVRHKLAENTADLIFLSIERGVEGILQGILQGTKNTGRQQDTIQQVVEKNMALFGDVEIVSVIVTHIRGHGIEGDGFIIGRGMGRGVVGKSGTKESIGGSKTQVITLRGE
tara:strand:+ start:239 stop:1660 length:1422 start_codon:yes stop_codon:yes gene_type:complete